MNSSEAKEVLLRYRAGSSDEGDPEVRAALEEASRDPALAWWVGKHQEFQRSMKSRFGDMDVPEGLREQILSESRASASVRRSPLRLAVGALALVAIVVGSYVFLGGVQDRENRFSTYRARMVKASQRGYAMEVNTASNTALRGYLETREAVSDWTTPPGLNAVPLMGGAVLKWRGRPATMICFGAGLKPDLWLFVVRSGDLPDPPEGSRVVFERVNQMSTLSWTRDGRTYLLVGAKKKETLRQLAQPGA